MGDFLFWFLIFGFLNLGSQWTIGLSSGARALFVSPCGGAGDAAACGRQALFVSPCGDAADAAASGGQALSKGGQALSGGAASGETVVPVLLVVPA